MAQVNETTKEGEKWDHRDQKSNEKTKPPQKQRLQKLQQKDQTLTNKK